MWDRLVFGFPLFDLYWFFFVYALLGWALEVVYCTLKNGRLTNRGFLYGPVCPMYGFGMLLVLVFLTPLQHSLPALFLGGALLASVLEYLTGWALEKLFHTRWWDYSGEPFNLQGYICLRYSAAWGLGCVFVMRFLHPTVAALVHRLPAGRWLAVPVAAVFLYDLVMTVLDLSRLDRDLGELDRLSLAMDRQTEKLSRRLGTAALETVERIEESGLATRIDEARLDMALARMELEDRAEEMHKEFTAARDSFAERAWERIDAYAALSPEELRQRYEKLAAQNRAAARRLHRAFPILRRMKPDHEHLRKLWEQK